MRFSEPVDPSTITPETLRVFDSEGKPVAVIAADVRGAGNLAYLTFEPLPAGKYTLEVSRDDVRDLAGNAVGGGVLATPFGVA